MTRLSADALLTLPHDPVDAPVHRLLERLPAPLEAPATEALWGEAFFGLAGSTVFARLPEVERNEVLARLSRGLIEEGIFIEKSGMAYASRMSLLASSTETRMLYCAFAGEEATHYRWLCALHPGDVTALSPSPFHRLVADVVAEAERDVALAVIQILLEGWGIRHYQRLAQGCRVPAVATLFRRIVKDEARHHGAGLALSGNLDAAGQVRAIAWVDAFLGFVHQGPLGLLSTVDAVAGLSPAARQKLAEEVGARARVATQLAQLRALLWHGGLAPVVAALEERHRFVPDGGLP